MYYPTTRVLTVLELLQSHPVMTGAEIARRLEVDVRTARRYITMLEELGIPVTADRGRYGGYRLTPGFKLPPLMLTEGEALALTLGLRAAQRLGLAAHAPAVEGALAKVERVLPHPVRSSVRAVEESLAWDVGGEPGAGPDGAVILAVGTASRERRRVALRYRRPDGEETERQFDPYGLVCRRSHWYTAGHCHLRGGVRLFRLDRIREARVLDETFERPAGFDVLEFVLCSLGSVPRHWPVEVLLETTLEQARRQIAPEVAVVEATEAGVVLRCYTDDLPWLARILARLDCPFIVNRPAELREAIRRHARALMEAVGAEEGRH